MAVGQQADEQSVHEVFLTDHDAAEFGLERGDPTAVFLHGLGQFLGRRHPSVE